MNYFRKTRSALAKPFQLRTTTAFSIAIAMVYQTFRAHRRVGPEHHAIPNKSPSHRKSRRFDREADPEPFGSL